MLNHRSTFIQKVDNENGQIALFVALVFQILFLFFAMVINVGLLVHHKINLQNSVDLAAYYGAMRQAETMNVIAHTNYQIRQSWKLLSWRYRMLGSAGDFEEHPFNKPQKKIIDGDLDGIRQSSAKFYDAPAFCITYIPFAEMPTGENTCKSLVNQSGIQLFKVPPVLIDLPGISHKVADLSRVLRDSAINRCKTFGSFNYYILAKFVVAFNVEQGNRMLLLSTLSRSISPSTPKDDFFDIDGKSVHEGMLNTLKNNLTSANNNSDLEHEFYNSLGDPNCNASNVDKGSPAKWLKPVKIAPGFKYIDTNCSGGSVTPVGRLLEAAPNNWPEYTVNPPNTLKKEISEIAPFVGFRNPLSDIYNYSIGVEKNPWCMAYVGVSAKSYPKIPFSPFGRLALKARAFYKPFGGRIGPWYYKQWPSGMASLQGSSGGPGDKVDAMMAPRISDINNLGAPDDPSRAANYSRFPGDKWGLKSRRVLAQYGQGIFRLNDKWSANGTTITLEGETPDYGDGAPAYAHWEHLPADFGKTGSNQDVMAWNSKKNQPSRMRELEMAAILPDVFDMTYYSIEPDFYNNYYTRIKEGFLKGYGASYTADNKEFLGDLGTHKGASSGKIDWDKFSIKDQYKVVADSVHLKTNVDIDAKLTYISKKWQHLLTSWAPMSLLDYSLNTEKFGDCHNTPPGADSGTPEVPNPGNCVIGGTTGYSVKMVSSDYLRMENLELGGEGIRGPLLNPPPSEGEF